MKRYRRATCPGGDQEYAGRGRRVCQGADERERAGQSQTAALAAYLKAGYSPNTVESAVSCAAHGFKTLPPYDSDFLGTIELTTPGGIKPAQRTLLRHQSS